MENEMQSLRVLSKGKVTDLSQGFSLGGEPFSVYVRSKKATMENDTVLDCTLICDKQSGGLPVPLGDWTPAAIVRISPNAIDLAEYDVYWGAGSTIKNQ